MKNKINFFIIIIISLFIQCNSNSTHNKKRFVSLSPSITSMFIDLDACDYLIGVTRYHPPLPENKNIQIIGDILNPNIEIILKLNPQLIIYSQDDLSTQKIEKIKFTGIKTLCLPKSINFESICSNYLTIAKLVSKQALAEKKIQYYKKIKKSLTKKFNKKGLILISSKPLIAVTKKSYISNIFNDFGITNILNLKTDNPYPLINAEYILANNYDILITLFNDISSIQHLTTKQIIIINFDTLHYYTPNNYCKSLIYIFNFLKKVCY